MGRAFGGQNLKRGDTMRKVTTLILVTLLFLSTAKATTGSESIKILIDDSRVNGWSELEQAFLIAEAGFPADTDWTFSFENREEGWGYTNVVDRLENVGSVDIRDSGKLSYKTLRNYDVLVIGSFKDSYSDTEADAIKQFVENGGGLLLLADNEYPNNSVSRPFDVTFYSEDVTVASKKGIEKTFRYMTMSLTTYKAHFFYVTDIKNHPVTSGIDSIAFEEGIPISSYTSGTVLVRTDSDTWADRSGAGVGSKQDDEDEGPFDIILAMEMGKGRAVFIGSAESFQNVITENERQNLDLIENAVEWLGGPGGPYKQYQTLNEQAQQKLDDATSLFKSHNFSYAKTAFEEAISIFEQSNVIYENPDATNGIDEANSYLEKCETGMEADTVFGQAESYFDKREYEKAIEEYEKAKSLYEEIEYTGRAEECTEKVEESNKWIALRDEATSLLSQAEQALTTAPSTFSTAGYENAKALFEKAKSKWTEYNDPAQVSACEEKITLCSNEIARISRNRMLTIVGVIVIVVVVVVVAVLFMRRRKPKPVPEVPPVKKEGIEALETLKDRYARGEITKEEYEKLKSVLEK